MNFFNKSITKRILGILLSATVVCSAMYGCSGGTSNDESSAKEAVASATSKPPASSKVDKVESSKPVLSKSESSAEESSAEESSESSKTETSIGYIEIVENFNAEAVGTNSINLNWSPVSDISGYEIYRKYDSTSADYDKIMTIKNSSTTFFNDNQIVAGTRYYYQIRPYIYANDKYYYGEFSATNAFTQIADVSEITVTARTSSSIAISWDRITNATAYTIYRKDSTDDNYTSIATITDWENSAYTDTGLTVGKTYYYKVDAFVSFGGESYYSNPSEISTYTPPEKPSFTASYDEKTEKIKVSWNAINGAEGYSVQISDDEDGDYDSYDVSDKLEFELKVKKNKMYYIKVYSYCSIDGEKKFSSYEMKSLECGEVPKVHGYDVGDTYIEISLDKQHMWYYKDGKLIVSTDVVTGYKNAHDTPTGLYYVINKASPAELVGETWDVWVNFWLGVTYDGVGIHDSTWRTGGYGGNIYTYDGSHGCINTPYDAVKKIYDNCKENTPVVIY